MCNYHTLGNDFLQYKRFLGYKYKTDEIVIKEIIKYLENNNINIITKEIVEDYARINSNLSPNTIARNMGVFREFCKYLKLQKVEAYQIPNGIYTRNSNNYIPYIFSKKEMKNIYNSLNSVLNSYRYNYYRKTIYPLIIKILYQTGMRLGEVLSLKINDYDIENGILYIKDPKNNIERLICLPKNIIVELNNYISKFNYLFTENNVIFNAKSNAIEKYFYKVLKEVNINRTNTGPRLHDLRHTFVVHRIEKYAKEQVDFNAMLPVLQAHLGHQSLSSLTYYFHMTKHILKDINRVSEEYFGYLIPKDGE